MLHLFFLLCEMPNGAILCSAPKCALNLPGEPGMCGSYRRWAATAAEPALQLWLIGTASRSVMMHTMPPALPGIGQGLASEENVGEVRSRTAT